LRVATALAFVVAVLSLCVNFDIAQSSGHAWATLSSCGVSLAAFSLWFFLWRRLRRPERRTELGQCPECGYDRRGLAADAKCPECGTVPAPPSE
jgi:hypothetical protein